MYGRLFTCRVRVTNPHYFIGGYILRMFWRKVVIVFMMGGWVRNMDVWITIKPKPHPHCSKAVICGRINATSRVSGMVAKVMMAIRMSISMGELFFMMG